MGPGSPVQLFDALLHIGQPLSGQLVLRLGAADVLANVEPSAACNVEPFTFCSAWKEVSFDVTGLGGRTLYVEATSTERSFFEPVHEGFLVAEPHFGN